MTDGSEALTGRPQDQGRPHRRRGAPSPETASLLLAYRAAMRAELRAVLDELRGKPKPAGLGLLPEAAVELERPSIEGRVRLWDLGIKLGRELGAEVDEPPAGGASEGAGSARPRRRRRVDFG